MDKAERQQIREEYEGARGWGARLQSWQHIPALLSEIERLEKERDDALNIVREVERTRRSDAWGAVVSRARGLLARLAAPSSPGRERE